MGFSWPNLLRILAKYYTAQLCIAQELTVLKTESLDFALVLIMDPKYAYSNLNSATFGKISESNLLT